MTDKEKLEKIKALADKMYSKMAYLTTDTRPIRQAMEEYHQFIVNEYNKEEPVSEDLKEASKNYALNNTPWDDCKDEIQESFKAGAKWKKENLWKSADGDDLPEYDKEVIVLIKYNAQRNINDEEYPTYRVGFGHRPNPDGWDGKNIDTNEVTHYTPKLYDKGGWNAPNIVYWLDVELPKEIELWK